MKYFYFFALVFCVISCSENKKNYYYIETYEQVSFLNGRNYIENSQPDTIIEISDSSAYMEAFKKFTISKKVSQDMNEFYGKVSKKPLSFQLLDKVGNDITYTTFFNEKESLEKELEKSIFSSDNSIKEAYDRVKKTK